MFPLTTGRSARHCRQSDAATTCVDMPGPPFCTRPSVCQRRAGDPSAADCAQQSGGLLRAAAIVTAPVRFACLYTGLSRNTALPCLLSPPLQHLSLFILAHMCCPMRALSTPPPLPCQTSDPVCSFSSSSSSPFSNFFTHLSPSPFSFQVC